MAYNNISPTPGAFTEFTQRYGTEINSLLGHFGDMTATKQYNEAIKSLDEFEKSKLDSEKFTNLRTKLSTITPEMLPFTKKVNEKGYDFDNPNWVEGDYQTQFEEYYKKVNPNATDYTKEDLIKYVEAKPDLKKQLEGTVYKDMPKDVSLTAEEFTQNRFDVAGFTPEDTEFFKNYENQTVTTAEHNRKLLNLINEKTPNLMSRGLLGTVKAEQFQNRALLLQRLEEKSPEWKFMYKGNKLYKYNDQGQISVISEDTPEEKWDADGVEVDENGQYYYYKNEPDGQGGWIKRHMGFLSSDAQDKKTKMGLYAPAPKKGSGRGGYKVGKSTEDDAVDEEKERKIRELKARELGIGKIKDMSLWGDQGSTDDQSSTGGLWADDIQTNQDEYVINQMEGDDQDSYKKVLTWVRMIENKWKRDLTTEEWGSEFEKHREGQVWSPVDEDNFANMVN